MLHQGGSHSLFLIQWILIFLFRNSKLCNFQICRKSTTAVDRSYFCRIYYFQILQFQTSHSRILSENVQVQIYIQFCCKVFYLFQASLPVFFSTINNTQNSKGGGYTIAVHGLSACLHHTGTSVCGGKEPIALEHNTCDIWFTNAYLAQVCQGTHSLTKLEVRMYS